MRGRLRRRLFEAISSSARSAPSTITHGPMRGLLFTGGDTAGYSLGASEPAVQQAIATHLKPGDVFYDVGTNVGFLALLAAKSVGPEGHVYCFEPQPEVIGLLARNLDQNGFSNYEIIEAAVSDHSGTAQLLVAPGDRSGTARLAGEAGGQARPTLEVRLVTLDELDLPAAALIKIDVEGAESQVLRGMRRLMREQRPTLIIEIHGEQRSPVEALLDEAGYRFDVLNDDGMPHLLARPS